MSEINRVLGKHGSPIPLVAGGKTWQLSPLTKRVQGEVETWLEERALAAAERMRDRLNLDDAGYARLLGQINRDIAARVYAIGGAEYRGAVRTLDGVTQVLYTLLKPNHPSVTREAVEDLMEYHGPAVQAALERVVGELKERVQGKQEAGAETQPDPLLPAQAST